MAIHLFEAIFAMMICTYMDFEYGLTLKWGLNVLVNGVFALRYNEYLKWQKVRYYFSNLFFKHKIAQFSIK